MKNYIGNNNEINKKKYKKSLPPKLNPDAGNVEHNIDMFNKASSGDANLSSAAGMNGMAESYDRDSLIARIIEFGKHYNFDKYTDAQLNAMLNRLVDAENYRKRVLPKHQNRIDIKSERHIMNDDPSYNFDDPEREGEYRVENLREALNRLDHYCIDNDKKFHDLRSLYENIQHQLTPQEKQELKKLVDTTNDPDAVKAYLDSKDPNKKNEELKEKYISEEDAITEALDQVEDKSSENLIAFRESNHPEIVPVDMDSYLEWYNKVDAKIKPLLESNDNLTYDELVALAKEHYKEGGMEIIEFWDENSLKEYEKEFGPMTKKQAIRLMKVMGNVSKDEEEAGEYFAKQTFEEGLNRKELETFSRAIFNAGDKKEALEIIDQIYQYDKDLSLQLKDMWDESASDAYNTDKLSGYLLRYNESLEEGVLDDLRAKRDAKKRAQDPLYDKMRSYEDEQKNPTKSHVNYDIKFNYADRDAKKKELQKAESVTFNIESIPSMALQDCSNIKKVDFEGKPIMIGRKAFMNCTGLTDMALPESIHTIEDEAFRGCSNLEHLTIPNTKVKIGKNVFEGCTKLVKSKNESLDIDSMLLTQRLFNRYPDISTEDEDYLNSLSYSDLVKEIKNRGWEEVLNEDTVKQGNKWVNKGDSGKTHGKFNTKKQADAQRKAMYANGYKGESLEEDIDSTLAARERRDRIEYLKNQIKEETKDWQTKFGDKGSVDIFKENDKKIRYAISPFIRHDNGESLDVIEKTFKEIIRKTNKYFNLEGTEKFRLKLNPMFVTIICP